MAEVEAGNQEGLAFVPSSVWTGLGPRERQAFLARPSWQWLLIADSETPEVLDFMAKGDFLTLVTCRRWPWSAGGSSGAPCRSGTG